MTTKKLKPINRISKYLGNGKETAAAAREDYISKIVFVEPPIGTFGAGEYIIVDQTDNALYGVKLGSAYDGHEIKLIPLIGPVAWTIVRTEVDTAGLIESMILLLSDFAATPPENRHEDLEDCIYEGDDYVADALLRMLDRRHQQRCEALVDELESIEREAMAKINGSGFDNTKFTTNAAADNNPTLVLLLDLWNLDLMIVWIL